MQTPQDPPATGRFDVFATAEEAWPAFERAVLAAKRELIGSFRIFDLTTKLHDEGVRAEVGEDWFDLLAHVARRGVDINIVVSDFDPVFGTKLHRICWRTVRQGKALAEIVGPGKGEVRIEAHLHPARAGLIPRLGFLPFALPKHRAAKRETPEKVKKDEAVRLDDYTLPPLFTVSHHHKIAVIDEELLYIGGLDLNDRRWDTREHDMPARLTWSDVQLMVDGPAAREGATHLREFRAVAEGLKDPSPTVHLARTISAPRRVQFPFLSPRTVLCEIEQAHLDAFRRAEKLIYIETQFIRSTPIAEGLAKAAKANPEVRLIFVLPALPEDVAFEPKKDIDSRYGLGRRRDATRTIMEAFGDRAFFASPVQRRLAARETDESFAGSPMIYVHNKLLVIDDSFGLIGSANLNGRSLHWDTEAALRIPDADNVAAVRRSCHRHWWPDGPEDALPVDEQFDWWVQRVKQQAVQLPENRIGLLVPFDPSNRADLAQDIPGATEDIV